MQEDHMEDLYSIHPSIPRSSNITESTATSTLAESLKAQIAGHPLYPALVSAHIDCRKVGAPPELACVLEEKDREIHSSATRIEMGMDPELDEFMESYCEVLMRYKDELSRPFDEATLFLSRIETQLSDLCKSSTSPSTTISDSHSVIVGIQEEAGSSSEKHVCEAGEVFEHCDDPSQLGDGKVKEMLLKKYSGYLRNLRKDFLKKRKRGKLPMDSRQALLEWWNGHCEWPYPTEEEKMKLAESTGLDAKQISNWFINQRKRHWKPSEDMKIALMDVSGGPSESEMYFEAGTMGP